MEGEAEREEAGAAEGEVAEAGSMRLRKADSAQAADRTMRIAATRRGAMAFGSTGWSTLRC